MSSPKLVRLLSFDEIRFVTGSIASMPSPPPPYTPPTPESAPYAVRHSSSRGSSNFVSSPLSSGISTAGPVDSRPPLRANPASQFPPPPPSRPRDKSSLGTDRLRSGLSGLTAIVRRSDSVEPVSSFAFERPSPELPVRPPASRRAVSADTVGPLTVSAGHIQIVRQSSPETGYWEPRMPLPPPPPGPPPTNNRSQSLNRDAYRSSSSGESNVRLLLVSDRGLLHQNTLGSIPPTPTDWNLDQSEEPAHDLSDRTNVTSGNSRSVVTGRSSREISTSDSIRERRSRSRPAHAPEQPKPADLVLSTAQGLIRRRRAQKSPAQSPTVETSFRQNVTEHITQPGPPSRTVSALTPPYTPASRANRGALSRDREYTARLSSQSAAAGPPLPPKIDNAPDSTKLDAAELELFVQASLDRYMSFVQQELSSATDKDRLELFANFMVHESRLRRDRYAAAFRNMAGEIIELTRDMWRPMSPITRIGMAHTAAPGTPMSPLIGGMGTRRSSSNAVPSSSSSTAEMTLVTDTESIGDVAENAYDGEASNTRGERFQPCLSPIPSMAASAVHNEDSSRGRSASRWWEGSAEGSFGEGGRRLERTKQETKYMSLHPDELMVESSPSLSTPTPSASRQEFQYGPDEYPAEKTGWHDQPDSTASALSLSPRLGLPSNRSKETLASFSTQTPLLDVSRLVTLPPPYPRHHPAVNNSHPALSDLRSMHRAIVADVSAIRSLIQHNRAKDADKMVCARLESCGSCIQKLTRSLEEDVQNNHTFTTQTEGDERPELLEQLTLLKWLFEAREQVQKQHLEVWSQHVKSDYMMNIRHFHMTGQFDAYEREEKQLNHQLQNSQCGFAEYALNRFHDLLAIVERHVSRGVEMQLSAFWDIAPELLEIVHKVPEDLTGFEIVIPPAEYDENPAYHQFPLQYLMTILSHAKQSAFQFIESQTNLFCLLHEVRTATTSASMRLIEIQRGMAGEESPRLHAEMKQITKDKEGELTEDLKDKVGEVERQWDAALGKAIEQCMERVEQRLQETGGWDESLDR